MATVAEWEEHFASLTPERREELENALKTLRDDPMFKEAYGHDFYMLMYSLRIPEVRSSFVTGVTGTPSKTYYHGFLIEYRPDAGKYWAFRNDEYRKTNSPSYVDADVDAVKKYIDDMDDEGEYHEW